MPVGQLLFNMEDPSCGNLFATVGGEQATVYDDMHMGDYIAAVLNFVNKRTAHAAGGVCALMLLHLSHLATLAVDRAWFFRHVNEYGVCSSLACAITSRNLTVCWPAMPGIDAQVTSCAGSASDGMAECRRADPSP